MYDWDDEKNASNRRKHGVDFGEMERLDWSYAVCADIQFVDGEERELWLGPIGDGIHAAIMTMRGDTARVISLRPATKPEKRLWKKETYNG